MEISDISTKSSSRIFLTTLGGRKAAGLYGPGAEIGGMVGVGAWIREWGLDAVAAAARSSPDVEGVNIGRRACDEAVVVIVRPAVQVHECL